MPGLYAHFLFGLKVKDLLPEELTHVIENHKEEYLLGLQGPDLLFYYHPLRRKPVTGVKIHWEPASGFLKNAVCVLREDGDEGGLAYIIGFICHFTLDSGCHPVIRDFMQQDGLSHAAIEAEFDRLLMRRQKIDPDRFSPKPLIPKGSGATACAEPFYPDAVRRQLDRSLLSMRCCLSILYSPRKTWKRMLKVLIFIAGFSKKGKGLVAGDAPDPECSQALDHLLFVFSDALATAQEQIENFLSAVDGNAPLNARFSRNFE
ncbi:MULTISPECIES: zinc dependent phospholipase C family protein [Acutalibacteraceae]|uniref:zinc dependent phospholipase C family protein n=1 Tax=Acutalibacteraceae TaxID=3082771 RepID=UPI0013E8D409|nr:MULTISPECIES: zinc dependent phospholipase C family protein [Acutalibacteraceae]